MRTVLLSLIVFVFTFSGYAQKGNYWNTGPNKNNLHKTTLMHPDMNNSVFDGVPGAKLFDFESIGTTWNDLQALNYGNTMQRMWVYPDGTVASTWVCEGEAQVPDRGAGYNYHDGSEWQEPTLHVGPDDRMGTVCYANWGDEGEIICSYQYVAGEGPMNFMRREVKGEGDWEFLTLSGPDGCSIVWQAMMTSGENNEYVHLLAYTYDAEFGDQANALVYYRSPDGGDSWDIQEEIIDGLDSDHLLSISALSYAFANPVGNTIAFTYGFDEWFGRVFKSSDNGDTWEYFDVYNTGYDPLSPPDASGNFGAGIGSSAIVLDSEAKVHLVFPRCVRLFVDASANYYSDSDGMIYWNEDMEPLDTTTISSSTLDYLEEGGNLIGWILADEGYELPADQPNYATALCGYPQMSIDANDNMYVAYSSVAPGYSNGLVDFRHIVANASFDGGLTWEGQEDLNTDLVFIFSECAFPMLPPFTDEYFHITYQEDSEPGIAGWLENHPPVENNIHYMKIEQGDFVDVAENSFADQFKVSDCYPNPASSNTMIQLDMQKASSVDLSVTNIMGQVVYQQKKFHATQGKSIVSIDVSDFSAGIYYCSVKSGDYKITRKFVVKK